MILFKEEKLEIDN